MLKQSLTFAFLLLAACGPKQDPMQIDLASHVDQPGNVRFAVTEGSANPAPVALKLVNSGDCQLDFDVTVSTTDGAAWLSVTPPPPGTVAAHGFTNLNVNVNLGSGASALGPGLYTGTLLITGTCHDNGRTAAGSPAPVVVTLSVTPFGATLEPGQSYVGVDVSAPKNTGWQSSTIGDTTLNASATYTVVQANGFLVLMGKTLSSTTLLAAAYDTWAGQWTPVSSGGPSSVGAKVLTSRFVFPRGRDVIVVGDSELGIYHPVSNTWTVTSLTVPTMHVVDLMGDTLIGINYVTSAVSRLDLTAATPAWTTAAAFPATSTVTGTAWTGTDLLVLTQNEFLSYSKSGNSWTTLPAGPQRFNPAMVWTGRELFVWSGADSVGQTPATGATYDPRKRTWTALPATTVTGRQRAFAAWTGTRVVIQGGKSTIGNIQQRDGAFFDPATGTWAELSTTGAPTTGTPSAGWFSNKLYVFTSGTGASLFTLE
ncbi:MAG: hypothetical protein K1X89_06670 [Myxococcaceae bacterium]|nr:hypothetical protein [Myxococcaceae bacterium]